MMGGLNFVGDEFAKRVEKELKELQEWRDSFRVTGAATFRNTRTQCTVVIAPARRAAPQQPATPEDTAQYQGMVKQVLVDNVVGYDFVPPVAELT